MGMLSKVLKGMVFKGGMLATGVLGMCLAQYRQLPYMLLVSTGIASLGLIGLMVCGFKQVEREEDEDPEYEERMAEFERIRPDLERQLQEQTERWIECERFLRERDRFERWAEQSAQLERSVRMLEQNVRQRGQAENERLLNEQSNLSAENYDFSSSSQHTGQIPQEGTGHGLSQEQVENLPAPEQEGSSDGKVDVAETAEGEEPSKD